MKKLATLMDDAIADLDAVGAHGRLLRLLIAIEAGEFFAADHDDATVQQAVRDGLAEPDYDRDYRGHYKMSLSLTAKGRAMLPEVEL